MKKVALILFLSMLFILGACSNNDREDQTLDGGNSNAGTEESQAETADDATNDDEKATDSENESERHADDQTINEPDNGEEASDNQLADLPEYEILEDEIDVNTLEAKIETDNPNKRVILYADDNGKQQYKSIFIKNENRLKIIQFNDNGQIFNGVI